MRMLGWISRLLLTTLLASTVSMLSTWTVIQLYVERVLEAYQLPGELDVKFTDFLAQAVSPWSGEAGTGKDAGLREEVNRMIEPDKRTVSDREQEQVVQGEAEDDPQSEAGDEPAMPDAVAVWGSGITQEESQEQDRLFISAEQFNEKRNELTEDDKWTIFTLVMSKLPKEELQSISTFMENGVTEAEMKELLSIMETYLEESEMEKLLEIVNKY